MLLENTPQNASRSVTILRYSFLICAFTIPFFGFIIPLFLPEAKEYLIDRFLLGIICLGLFIISYFNKDADKLRQYFRVVVYLSTVHALFLIAINKFLDIYVYIFIIAVFAFSHAFKTRKGVVAYLLFTLIFTFIVTVVITDNPLVFFVTTFLLMLTYISGRARVIALEREQNTYVLLATILNETVDAILLADTSGKIIGTNKRTLELFNAGDLEEFNGTKYDRLFDHHRNFQLKGDNKSHRSNILCKKLDNERFWGDVAIKEISNENKSYILIKITDIDEQLNAQEKLRKNEITLKSILESSTDQIWLLDKNFKLISYNDSFKRSMHDQFGVDISEGYNLLSHFEDPQVQYKHWKRDYDRALRGETFTIEETLRDEEFNILDVIQVTFNPVLIDNKVFGVSVFLKDITKLRKKELEYIKFRTAIDSTSEAIGIADLKGKSVYHNEAYIKLFGYTPQEVNAIGLSALFKDIDKAKAIMKSTLRGNPWSGEIILINKQGEEHIIYLKSDALKDDEGNTIGIIGLHRDITKEKRNEERLRQSEEKYRLISENTTDLICLHQLDGIYTYVSPSSFELLQFAPEELISKDPYDLIHPEDVVNEITPAHTRLLSGTNEVVTRYRMKRKNESYVWLETKCKLIRDKNMVPVALQSSSRDISAWKAAEDELLNAKNLAEAAANAKSEFLATMSHEIRTPLNAVIGMTDLLMESKLSNNQLDIAETIKLSGENLLYIINDILDYSKIEAGSLELEAEIVNVHELMKEVIDMLSSKANEKNLKLFYEIMDEVPKNILSDKMRLKQVLLNLVNNAIKFTYIGEVKVMVGMIGTDPATVKFSVVDTGVGIPEDKTDRLFKSFSQIDSSTTRKFGGTGLGLAISRKIIELMGGSIHVSSREGYGSTFSFILEVQALSDDAQRMKPKAHATSDVPLPKLKILMAEDNPINQKVTTKILERLGYETDIAQNGIEAIQMAKATDYDLILMDVQMPEMDGLEATTILRKTLEDNQQPIIIAMTANAFKEDKEICLNAGMDDYLSKPAQKKDIEGIIKKWFVREPTMN